MKGFHISISYKIDNLLSETRNISQFSHQFFDREILELRVQLFEELNEKLWNNEEKMYKFY